MAEEKTFDAPKVRARARKGLIDVRVKIMHNSYTGLIFEDGQYKSARAPYYLTNMKVYFDDTMVSEYQMSPATSPNPLIRFKLKATKSGTLRVVAQNSDGVTKEGSSNVKV